MATTAATGNAQILYERPDIHKSCKSLETLLSVLNDYCEAAGAVVSLQKKLAKALRESATSKATNDVAANALNASATIFEALSDIDSKFAKIADKEYDGISNEVKKWFKKLAKEEKNHDEKISNANGKIKQAGQIYEKKSKKNAREANDEHARYINLISSLGPEISQEKYNHTLLVSQRHSSTTFSVAACVSRIADGEWIRTCEGVRKFAPTIGVLGEYRALCEGGWGGPMPPDLPDIDEKPQYQPATVNLNAHAPNEDDRPPPPTYRNLAPSKAAESTEVTASPRSPHLNLQPEKESSPLGSPMGPRQPTPSPITRPTPPSSFDPPRPLVDPNTGSVRSLSAFPAPPTHFPPPLSPSQRHQQPSFGQSSQSSSTSNTSYLTQNRPTDVRIPTSVGNASEESPNQSPVSSSNPPSPQQRFQESADIVKAATTTANGADRSMEVRRPLPMRSATLPPPAEAYPSPDSHTTKGDMDEFGAGYKGPILQRHAEPKPVERSDTANSTGSIVAAMRNRYSYSGASSPPPKEANISVPRLPMSVNNLASRYQPSSPPRIRAVSPPPSRALPSIDTFSQARQAEASFRDMGRQQQNSPEEYRSPEPPRLNPRTETSYRLPSLNSSGNDETIRRQRRLEELEIQEKEQELRARELDIELKTRELERQRDTVRMGMPQPLERHRDVERYDSPPTPRYGASLGVPPSPSRAPSDESSHVSDSPHQLNALHPASCTCETCKRPGPGEKSKSGWMRRLSMPIVARSGNTMKGQGHGGLMSLDGKKGASTTMLAREDGRVMSGGRMSYDASNRSVTNLALGRR